MSEDRAIRRLGNAHFAAVLVAMVIGFTADRPWWVHLVFGAALVAASCFAGALQGGYEVRARQARGLEWLAQQHEERT